MKRSLEEVKEEFVGKQFNKLVILDIFSGKDIGKGGYQAKCQCCCGKMRIISIYELLKNNVQSCGCFNKELRIIKTKEKYFSNKIGKLKIIKYHKTINNALIWECLCDCGNITYAKTSSLIGRNPTQSCGCLARQNTKNAVLTRRLKYGKNYSAIKTFNGHSKQEWIDKFIKKFGNTFDYSLINTEELNGFNDIEIICPKHGKFTTKPSNHLRSIYGCFKCGDEYTGINQQMSYNEFVDRAKKIHNGIYSYCEKYYNTTNNHSYLGRRKIKAKCNLHGDFYQIIYNHLLGSKCPQCSRIQLADKQRIKIEDFIDRAKIVHGNKYDYSSSKIISDSDYVDIICSEHGIFSQLIFNHLAGHNCPYCTVQSSRQEILIENLLDDNNIRYIKHDRNIIKPKEIDFFIPQINLGIEHCGLYWHCELYKDKNYHLNKMLTCRKNDIRLIQIFEDEINNNKLTVRAKLRYKLNLIKNKIYARNCKVEEITVVNKNKFLQKYHLQGTDKSSIKYGLIYNKRLVAVMTFRRPKISLSKNNIYDWEISRYATLNNFTITGGFSKLLKHFENTINPKNLVSYSDNRWYDGDSYKQAGFKLVKETVPNYFWFKGNKRYHRYVFAKHKLKSKLKDFDLSLSEVENMKRNGYFRIWDCGSKVYFKDYNNENSIK